MGEDEVYKRHMSHGYMQQENSIYKIHVSIKQLKH